MRGVWYLLKLPFRKIRKDDSGDKVGRAEIELRWQRIEELKQTSQIANLRQAIIEADNLLDFVLKSKVSGDSLGERLKNAASFFERRADYQAAWEAHKVRNRLVHEGEVLEFSLQEALRNFEKALEGLGE